MAHYIMSILQNPSDALYVADVDLSNPALRAMTECLSLFPFIFILDEADQLNDIKSGTFTSGFEQLRRALSYLIPQTNIFFLTLGTESTIRDLNPSPRDDSLRYVQRKELLDPIVLLSNYSVYSRDLYPIENVKLTREILLNPIFFKLLATIGHPLWLSIPFNNLVGLAKHKLMNESVESKNHVLVLWMIRAGLMANPLDLNTRTLIVSQMASLFNLTPDLARMIVFYPSEPVLALACREILNDLNYSGPDVLFKKLDEFLETVYVDRG